jgi:hypothetical protein
MRDNIAEILANRATDVAARPRVIDLYAAAATIDADRRRQLEAARAPKPVPVAPEPSTGFRVVRNGSWHQLIGPDGVQVGKSKRTEADAWTTLDGG